MYDHSCDPSIILQGNKELKNTVLFTSIRAYNKLLQANR